jgi:hypothetical protein
MNKIIIFNLFKINLIKLVNNNKEKCYQLFNNKQNLEHRYFNLHKILDDCFLLIY